MTAPAIGRHRGADVSSATLLAEALTHHSAPVARAAATAAVTTGMVAVTALPAQAATIAQADPATTTSSLPVISAASLVPAVVTAPAMAPQAAPTAFGEMDFVAVEAPAPAAPVATAHRPARRVIESSRLRRAATDRATDSNATLAARSQDAPTDDSTRTVSASRSATRQRLSDRTSADTSSQLSGRDSSNTSSRSSDTSSRTSSRSSDSGATQAPATTPDPTPAPAPARRSTGGVLGTAAAYSGIYYVYGGTTPAGFDCSGFTQFVFGQAGISLPRTAEDQRQATTRVSDPQPGDLVFFGAPAYHVGIYAGGGQMYDSPRSGKATGLHTIWSSNVSYGRP